MLAFDWKVFSSPTIFCWLTRCNWTTRTCTPVVWTIPTRGMNSQCSSRFEVGSPSGYITDQESMVLINLAYKRWWSPMSRLHLSQMVVGNDSIGSVMLMSQTITSRFRATSVVMFVLAKSVRWHSSQCHSVLMDTVRVVRWPTDWSRVCTGFKVARRCLRTANPVCSRGERQRRDAFFSVSSGVIIMIGGSSSGNH